MAKIAGAKGPKLALLLSLIFAIICTLALSAGEAFSSYGISKDSVGSGIYMSPVDHSVDWLAEDNLSIGKAQGLSRSPLRNGLLRVFMFAGLACIVSFLENRKLKIINNNRIPQLINKILLKLRI